MEEEKKWYCMRARPTACVQYVYTHTGGCPDGGKKGEGDERRRKRRRSDDERPLIPILFFPPRSLLSFLLDLASERMVLAQYYSLRPVLILYSDQFFLYILRKHCGRLRPSKLQPHFFFHPFSFFLKMWEEDGRRPLDGLHKPKSPFFPPSLGPLHAECVRETRFLPRVLPPLFRPSIPPSLRPNPKTL